MDKCRREFEAWIKSETGFDLYRTRFPMIKYEDQQYNNHNTNLAWLSWKASRESMKAIKLPEILGADMDGSDRVMLAHEVIEAIALAGYKVEE